MVAKRGWCALLAGVVAITSFAWSAEIPDAQVIRHDPNGLEPVRPAANARRALAQALPSISADGQSLGKVLDYLRDFSGANFAINWKALEAVNVNKDSPVTLSLVDVPMRKALRLVLDQVSPETPLVFQVEDNVLTITTQAEADKVLFTRVYVVGDLVMPPAQVTSVPQLNLQNLTQNQNVQAGSGGAQSGGSGGLFTDSGTSSANTNAANSAQQAGDDLVKLITEVVRPNVWRENGGTATIKYFSGKLIVSAPLSVQEAIGGPMLPEGGQRLR